MNKKKLTWKQAASKYLPAWAFLPLISILVVNSLVYWGSGLLTANRYHYDFTFAFDRSVPLLPGFIWIYILAFPFWAVSYVLAAQRGKDMFYRFVATDLAVHLACFVVYIILPTTNIRPEIPGNTISEKMLQFMYLIDGGASPSNLLPSIHCYVSWLSFRGLQGAKEIPKWYQYFALIFAGLVIVSTQVLKQHYIVDAIAGIGLVEIAWHFFRKGTHHIPLMDFYEKWNKKIWKQKQNGDRL